MIRWGERPARPDPLFVISAGICTLAVVVAAWDCVATEVFLWGIR